LSPQWKACPYCGGTAQREAAARTIAEGGAAKSRTDPQS
jgi:hypothetical protein